MATGTINSKSSIIVKVTEVGLAFLGVYICGRAVRNFYRNIIKTEKEIREKEDQNYQSDKLDRTKIVDEKENVVPDSSSKLKETVKLCSDPDELLEKISTDIINSKKFENGEDFLRIMVNLVYLYSSDISWVEKMPKSVSELEDYLKTVGKYDDYSSVIYSISDKKKKRKEKILFDCSRYYTHCDIRTGLVFKISKKKGERVLNRTNDKKYIKIQI